MVKSRKKPVLSGSTQEHHTGYAGPAGGAVRARCGGHDVRQSVGQYWKIEVKPVIACRIRTVEASAHGKGQRGSIDVQLNGFGVSGQFQVQVHNRPLDRVGSRKQFGNFKDC